MEKSPEGRVPAAEPHRAFVCSGARCARRGSRFIRQALERAVRERGLTDRVQVLRTNGGCLGQCEFGPNVTVYPQGVRYFGVRPDDADEITNDHFSAGRIVARLLWSPDRFPSQPAAAPSGSRKALSKHPTGAAGGHPPAAPA
ncbi:MAG TPA: (2Fe-2S) ferredoxin domain-containing protein [Dehalococcoidia bacterium]|nr:(2Fe-2S) ferredoxin domain-containing protein [Dehalococcoidia bacterium]